MARVLEHLGESHLLPIFEAEEINDNVLPCLDPADLIGLGVSQMTCLTILGAAHSAAKNKKLETEDVLDNVAKHQSVLEEALREHRAEIARLRIRELPEDLCCSITYEIMKDPVMCVGDGHTYKRPRRCLPPRSVWPDARLRRYCDRRVVLDGPGDVARDERAARGHVPRDEPHGEEAHCRTFRRAPAPRGGLVVRPCKLYS